MLDKKVEQNYVDKWKDIIEKDGVMDKEQVKKELSDYSFVLANTTEIMDRLTCGRISKPFTYAHEVVKVVEDNNFNRMMVRDDMKDMLEYNDTLEGLKTDIITYFGIK